MAKFSTTKAVCLWALNKGVTNTGADIRWPFTLALMLRSNFFVFIDEDFRL